MKKNLCLLFACLWVLLLHAEHDKAFQRVSIKTDLFNPFNLGIELPIGTRGSLDINIRSFASYAAADISKTDFRVFHKKHFKQSLKGDNFQSAYFLSGFHYASWAMSNYPKQDWSKEMAELEAGFLALGVGKRFKMIDFWISADLMLLPIVNHYKYVNTYGQTTTDKAWKFPIMGFVGCSFNFLNFKV